ncbi:MerR family transcriptional regulator (plasmid) [Alicyclobacillus acidoterrestris]|uniref:MerR family transcriptional regulator n=1 Tax=Alicyclobacillus acidoterrestris TaxID=1450 RepID=UPI003F52E656
MGKWLTIKELSQKTGMPYSTAYRYLEQFDQFFVKDTRARGKRYEAESSATILARIQYLFRAEGLTAEGVEETLSKEFPIVIDGETPSAFPSLEDSTPWVTKEDLLRTFERMGQYMQRLEDKLDDASRTIHLLEDKLDNATELILSLQSKIAELEQGTAREIEGISDVMKSVHENLGKSLAEVSAAQERDETIKQFIAEWREERAKEKAKKPWWKRGKN